MTVDHFVQHFEKPNIPVIIRNACRHWNAFSKWSDEHIYVMCGDCTMRATSAAAPLHANFTAKQYFQYARETEEEAPLYLFERDFAAIAPSLTGDYSVPAYFQSSPSHHTDLFSVFGEKRRPDYRWLIMGPAWSGSIFHIDPNQTNAWNVCVRSRKKWIFYPPGVTSPGVKSSPDGAEVAVPISTGEWLLTFWKYHLEARQHPDPAQRPLEAIVNPGDIMFVPHGYWHMVVNLDDCIALTHNYVSTSNLADVLRFLRETPDQISGVRDRAHEAVQPEGMYEEFVERLRPMLGEDALNAHIAQSHCRTKSGGDLQHVSLIKTKKRKNKTAIDKGSSKLFKVNSEESFSFDFF